MSRTKKLHPAAVMAGDWWADRISRVDLAAACRKAVAKRVDAALRGVSSWGWDGTRTDHNPPIEVACVDIEHDYDPRFLLAEVAGELLPAASVGELQDLWPRKHSLDVYRDRMVPKEGYGNLTETIPVLGTA